MTDDPCSHDSVSCQKLILDSLAAYEDGTMPEPERSQLKRHLEMFEKRLPSAVPLFKASGLAQLPLARALGEAPSAGYDAIEAVLKAK